MSKYLLIFFLCSCFCYLSASTPDLAANQQLVELILKNIITITGEQKEVPKIQIRSGKSNIAEFNTIEHKIYIDEAAIEICNRFLVEKESALAFLIGHELAHYYQQYKWEETATSFLNATKVFKEQQKQEKEADLFGAFLSHLAGYKTVEIIPALLEQLYIDYEVKDNETYPDLKERMKVATQVCDEVQRLLEVHDAANYAMVIGAYTSALEAYEYLSQFVTYRELYNNIGVASLYAAMLIRNRQLPFIYPLIMEQDIPLRKPLAVKREELLQKAVRGFKKALQYGDIDFSTSLNLACAYELSNKETDFQQLIEYLKTVSTSTTFDAKLYILEGIHVAQLDENQALELFKEAIKLKTNAAIKILAKKNKKILQKKVKKFPAIKNTRLNLAATIDGVDLFSTDFRDGKRHKLANQLLFISRLKSTTIYVFKEDSNILKINYTANSSPSTYAGVRKGNTLTEIEEVYGETYQQILTTSANYFLSYPERGIFFKLDRQNTIVGWGTFVW